MTALTSTISRIITNDLYLAAYLLSQGKELDKILRNGRRRLSFVLAGERVGELKDAYNEGPVYLDVRSFRESLTHIRKIMDTEQRSVPCPKNKILQKT